MFFSPPYACPPAGLYSPAHFILLFLTAFFVTGGLLLTRHADPRRVRRIVREVTALLWALEISKIFFVLFATGLKHPNDFVPLYYCSLLLYAGLLSSVGRGFLRRVGDVFLSSGGIVGGVCFLLCPNTSLPRYPAVHFISLHSFLLHGLMVYLGLLLLLSGTVRLRRQDVFYNAGLVSVMCLCAFLFNLIFDRLSGWPVANLMFLSKDFPGTPVSLLYRIAGPVFPVAMWLLQSFVPFYLVYAVYRLFARQATPTEAPDAVSAAGAEQSP